MSELVVEEVVFSLIASFIGLVIVAIVHDFIYPKNVNAFDIGTKFVKSDYERLIRIWLSLIVISFFFDVHIGVSWI